MQTIIEHFYQNERSQPQETYLKQPYGSKWKEYSWAETGQQARKIAAALHDMGLKAGAHVGIVSKNCAHWIMADLAIMMGGYVSVPFFPNLNAEQLREVLTHSEVEVLFVGKIEDWERMKDGVPDHVKVIVFPHYEGNSRIDKGLQWNDLIEKYPPIEQGAHPDLEDLWTIIYTSGTTGTPKGVMLPYKSVTAILEGEKTHRFINLFGLKEHRFFSYLPLNHIAERMIVESCSLMTGGTVSFAETIDSFVQNLSDTRPTVFLAVPRIWTKFQMGILAKMPESKLNLLLKIPLLSSLVRKKIQKGLGLDQAEVLLTGAAPTPVPLLKFFKKLKLNIQEVYGMTENAAGCTVMPADNVRYGSVGQPMPDADLKTEPESGEVLMKAPWLMTGYYKAPEQTAEVLKDGWLYTGDKGEIDPEGFLFIKGRVKDAFKTTKGEYIVPGPIEALFARDSLIEQICVVGLGLPQPMALVVLSEGAYEFPASRRMARLQETLEVVNRKLPNHERIHRLVVVKENWDPVNNILTPTLKVKRNMINDVYASCFEKWYQSEDHIIQAEAVLEVSTDNKSDLKLNEEE